MKGSAGDVSRFYSPEDSLQTFCLCRQNIDVSFRLQSSGSGFTLELPVCLCAMWIHCVYLCLWGVMCVDSVCVRWGDIERGGVPFIYAFML